MVIIFQVGEEFWIESVESGSSQQNANTSTTFDRPLERPGIFLGCATAVSSGGLSTDQFHDLSVKITETGGSTVLLFGSNITGVRLTRVNENGVNITFGVNALVFMRKNQ